MGTDSAAALAAPGAGHETGNPSDAAIASRSVRGTRVWSSRLGRRLLGLVIAFAALILAMVLANLVLAERLSTAIDAQQRSVAAIAQMDALAEVLRERETLDLRAVSQLLAGDTVALSATRQSLTANDAVMATAMEQVGWLDRPLVETVSETLIALADQPADIAEALMDGDAAAARQLTDRQAAAFAALQTAIADRSARFATVSATAAAEAARARQVNGAATGLLGVVALLLVGTGVAYAWRRVLVPLTALSDGLNRLAGHAADGPDRDEVKSLTAAFDRLSFLERDRAARLAELDLRDRAISASLDGMAIMAATPDLPILYANSALAEIFGIAPDRLLQTSAIGLLAPSDDREATAGEAVEAPDDIVPKILEAIGQGAPLRIRGRGRRGRRTEFWYDLTLAPVTANDEGARAHYVAILRDITDQVTNETALRTATRESQAANHLKSLFLGNISHEVRTPLNAILGFTEVLRTEAIGPDDPRYEDYLGEVQRAGESLLTTISRIIDIARLESGETAPRMEPIRLARLIDEAIESVAQPLEAASVTTIVTGPVDTLAVLGDRRLLHTALLQVLGNAIRFSPPGGCVAIDCRREGESVTVAIRDEGHGMTEEQAAIALSLFGQVRRAVDYAGHSGLGLGLPIAVRIIEAHGGRLHLDSEPDRGTVAKITLRRATDPQAPTKGPLQPGQTLSDQSPIR